MAAAGDICVHGHTVSNAPTPHHVTRESCESSFPFYVQQQQRLGTVTLAFLPPAAVTAGTALSVSLVQSSLNLSPFSHLMPSLYLIL